MDTCCTEKKRSMVQPRESHFIKSSGREKRIIESKAFNQFFAAKSNKFRAAFLCLSDFYRSMDLWKLMKLQLNDVHSLKRLILLSIHSLVKYLNIKSFRGVNHII